ncbi:MAG: pyridoxal 5'-phosphate synthase glutaminase subunit PdxT [Nanoarchaeota archaeon]|nr:pyridoxal 5'-phosphate synthase glutaminase subunit PdxT [Nanoarchaeota archaeon]
MKVGVLALQGDFREHISILKKLKLTPIEVRTKEELDNVKALIIPGGESTTIGKLLKKYQLDKEIKKRYKKGMPIYGTCAGAIVLAKEIIDSDQLNLDLIDVSIERNAYGRQADSFEADISLPNSKKPFHAIFIRAPKIKQIRNGVKILSKHKKEPILARTDNILISTFHPELTEDTRIHEYFIQMAKDKYN